MLLIQAATEITLDQASNLAQIGSVLVTMMLGVFAIWKRIDRRQAQTEMKVQRIDDRLERIEKQFGPNGGGLREAVNNMANTVAKIDGRVTSIGDDVARLSGQFDQHIIEGD